MPNYESFGQFGEQFHKVLPIALISKGVLPLVAAGGEVKASARPLDAQKRCHAAIQSLHSPPVNCQFSILLKNPHFLSGKPIA